VYEAREQTALDRGGGGAEVQPESRHSRQSLLAQFSEQALRP
jgi:hypothetical protein